MLASRVSKSQERNEYLGGGVPRYLCGSKVERYLGKFSEREGANVLRKLLYKRHLVFSFHLFKTSLPP